MMRVFAVLGSVFGIAILMSCSRGPGTPTVTTRSASPLGLSAMTVNGSVNPHGRYTTYHFEYGSTPSYGARTRSAPLPARLAAYYHESWDEGTGGWQTWGLKGEHHSAGGAAGGYLSISEPSSLNDYNHEMAGKLHLVKFFYCGAISPSNPLSVSPKSAYLGGGDPDFRDARVRLWVRGRDWHPNGSELVWWTQSQSNIRLVDEPGWRRCDWAFTGFSLNDFLSDGQWHSVDYRLMNDASLWTYGGNNPALQGRSALRYEYWPIDRAQAHLNNNLFHLLAFVDPENPPRGSMDFDEFEVAYRNRSLTFPANGGKLIASPKEGTDPATLSDGWRHGPDRAWRSGPNPSGPLEFVYAFERAVTIHAVQLHQNPEWPAREVEVEVSRDGTGYRPIARETLPEKAEPNDNFGFKLATGLRADARFLRVRIRSGYRSQHWGLGEIEVFGTGAVMLPDDDVYYVNTDIHSLTPGETYHYRLVATSESATAYGADRTFTMPATNRPHVVTAEASRLTASGAKVEGRLNPLGLPTYYYFEYGRDPAYGSKTDLQYGGLDITPRTVMANLDGLEPATTYRYRLVALNGAGVGYADDRTFATVPKMNR